MKYSDYYRHYLELLATGQVTFPCRKTLAEFVAKLVARDYKAHIQTAKFNCIWPDWFLELEQREMSEPSLVEMYVNAFLTDKMAEMDTFWYKLKGMFGRNHNRNKIYFDTVYCVPTCSYFLENMKDCSFLFNIDIINFFAYNVA